MSDSGSGSEGSPARARPLRRIRKVMVLSSASDTDSDGDVLAAPRRRKRLRVVSDGSGSSDSSIVPRRRRAGPLRASSGSSSDVSDTPRPASAGASDSSEGNSDKCSICLLRFRDQEVGTPHTCEHIFCLDCITEWSKNVNTCPVDRMTFTSIVVRECAGGRVLRSEPVKLSERRPSVEVMVVEDPTPCEICGSVDNEETMLLCDGCDLGYHMECLTPPLTQVPEAQWLCPNCDDLLDVINLSELNDLFHGMVELPAVSAPRPARRAAPRARARSPAPSTSRPPAPAPPRTRRRRRRARGGARRTQTVVVEYEVETGGKFPVTETVRRKIRRRKRVRRPRTAARRSLVRARVRARLAALDGFGGAGSGAGAGAAPALSLFGLEDRLEYFSDEEPAEGGGGAALAVGRASRPTPAALHAYRQARRKMSTIPSPPPATAPPDLLSSILESQSRLHGRLAPPSRVDPRAARAARRQTPAYPGQQTAGGRGWGGGYRGTYPRGHAGPPRATPAQAAPSRDTSRAPPRPLPEPPVFRMDEEEPEDADLVIDTDKYDPTEPTRDEDSGDDARQPPPPPLPSPPPPPALTGLEGVLDEAVRAVLQQQRTLGAAAAARSDSDEDGDCPNFSIYSATSVHIATNSSLLADMSPPPTAAAPTAQPVPVDAARSKEDEYKERVSKRCPITADPRDPIKIKLNAPALIKRQVTLYDDEEPDEDVTLGDEVTPVETIAAPEHADTQAESENDVTHVHREKSEEPPERTNGVDSTELPDTADEPNRTPPCGSPAPLDFPPTPPAPAESEAAVSPAPAAEDSEDGALSEDSRSMSEGELRVASGEAGEGEEEGDDLLGKMTESISETEDERSYTPCLDENKSKDTSLETDKDRALEGLDTELISEEEANDLFSDAHSERSPPPVEPEPAAEPTPAPPDDNRKKKKKDSKKEGKDKSKSKGKKSEISFKKLSKSGKERNYRERDKEEKGKSKKDRRESDSAERKQRRKEKRKDLERYDVRSLVTEKRKQVKDAFGRDVSPRASDELSPEARLKSPRRRRSTSPAPSVELRRRSLSRRSLSRHKSPRRRRSASPAPSVELRRRSLSRHKSPRRRRSTSPVPSVDLRRRSLSRHKSPRRRRSTSPAPSVEPRRRSLSRHKSPRRRRSTSRGRKRARRSAEHSPKPKPAKKKKRARSSPRRRSPRRKSRKRLRRSPVAPPPVRVWSPPSVDSCLLSPRTPPPEPAPPRRVTRRRRERERPPPSKEVFTSGDNILVSVSFKDKDRDPDDEERRRKDAKREKRRRRKRAAAALDPEPAKPVAIIDLERSPFRELTPSPKNVIVLSDSDAGDKEPECEVAPPAPVVTEPPFAVGPKTPPEPAAVTVKFALPAKPGAAVRANPLRELEEAAPGVAEETRGGPATPPDSPDAYDPFEPTRSASGSRSPSPRAPPPAGTMTLETAQKTNMSADDVLDRRPLSPIEKVMALLQSTRDVPPDPPPPAAAPAPAQPSPPPAAVEPAPPAAPQPRIVLPEPARSQPPKPFLNKPSPIKSNPVKPMQATKISRLPLPPPAGADSPYSPGSSDFGDLFSPPPGAPRAPPTSAKRDTFDALLDKPAGKQRRGKSAAARVPVKLNRKKGKTQVGVKIDEDNLKILDDLPSSAVEMQVKSKFLKKLNRQERVVEEVKLVLKPHYNKKRVTKDEYKDILRRAVPKICHNKTGEINPSKIQALVEAYVKKVRKKHKLGLA